MRPGQRQVRTGAAWGARGIALCGVGMLVACTATVRDSVGAPDARVPAPDAAATGLAPWLPAPRLIAPLSTATVTSQRPTLHWELANEIDGAEVQICADRACTTVEQQFAATGSSGRPDAPLTPGIHFWRLHGRRAAVEGAASSPVWEVAVGRRSAPVDTSGGSFPDFNGDGYADVVIGGWAETHLGFGLTPNDGYAYIDLYSGGPHGIDTTRAATQHVPIDAQVPAAFGFGVDPVLGFGDINGDGYVDLVVGSAFAYASTPLPGRIYFFPGGSNGIGPGTEIAPPSDQDSRYSTFGYLVAGAGDLNGDGYADVVVGEIENPPLPPDSSRIPVPNTLLHVYLGTSSGLSRSPSLTLDRGHCMNGSLAAGEDINGDGLADLALCTAFGDLSPYDRSLQLWLDIHFGDREQIVSRSPLSLSLRDSDAIQGFDGTVAGLGDIDGDGYADLAVGGTLEADVFHGSSSGLRSLTPMALDGPPIPSSPLDRSWLETDIRGVGDINGDGLADVLVFSCISGSRGADAANLYLGDATRLRTDPASTFSGLSDADPPCWPIVPGGDINGDGYADLVVKNPAFNSPGGRVEIFEGNASGLLNAPANVIVAPNAADARYFFGFSVASATDAILSWGHNLGGRLGDGTTIDRHLPTPVAW